MEPSRPPVARLRWGAEERLLYPNQKIKVGRAAENEIVLNDPRVSRNHAELEWNGTGFTRRDLGSANGTSVNGQRLANAARMLRDGDEILLSKQVLSYEIIRAEKAEPPARRNAAATTEPLSQVGSHLIVSAGPDMGQDYPLWGEIVTIGRASREATWEIRLTDRAVSRPHARLEHREKGFFLVDLESANGTLLNGARVRSPCLLKEGDVISIGETRLTFHAGH